MPEPTTVRLAAECRVFCRYLIGKAPGARVTEAYCRAHDQGDVARGRVIGTFDRVMVWLARSSPVATALVDAYAAVFAKTGLLRRKLVLLLAIMESSWPTCEAIDSVDSHSRTGLVIGVGLRTLMFAVAALATGLVLSPVRAGCVLIDHLPHRTAAGQEPDGR